VALDSLAGITPAEVSEVLAARRRWPRLATDPGTGITVLTIWGRSQAGRPLIVAVREIGELEWQIVGARPVQLGELPEFEEWEAKSDD
jgi:hypothetical protein